MKDILLYIRLKDWWNFIIPPVLSFYFLGLLIIKTNSFALFDMVLRFITFLILTTLIAAFGFFLNEWTDINDDKIAGKKNELSELNKSKIWIIFCSLLFGIFSITYFIKWNTLTLVLLLFQLTLFILYSLVPFRLKRNKYIAIILDALYSGTIFYIIAILIGSNLLLNNLLIIFSIFFWAFIRGIRNIIHHLIKDKKHDELLSLQTLATISDTEILQKKIKTTILPIEIVFFLALLYSLPYHCIFISSYLLFLCYVYYRKEYVLPFILKRKNTIEQDVITDINLFYEIIMPVLTLTLLVLNDYRTIVLFFLSLILFPQISNWRNIEKEKEKLS